MYKTYWIVSRVGEGANRIYSLKLKQHPKYPWALCAEDYRLLSKDVMDAFCGSTPAYKKDGFAYFLSKSTSGLALTKNSAWKKYQKLLNLEIKELSRELNRLRSLYNKAEREVSDGQVEGT